MGWPDPIEGLSEAVGSLTREQVNAAIARHIHPDRLDIVIVTQDGAALTELLRSEAPAGIEYPAPAPAADHPQAEEDKRFSEAELGLGGIEIVSTEDLFR